MTQRPRLAEREGFEPSRGSSPLLAFQASAFNRSTTSPYPNRLRRLGAPPVLRGAPHAARAPRPQAAKPLGPPQHRLCRLRVVGVLLAALLVGAVPLAAERHAVTGHFNVPHQQVPTPMGSPSSNVITNSGFESGSIDGGWYPCGDVGAYTTTEHPYRGTYDEYSGTRSGVGEPRGNSGVCQRVTVPVGRFAYRMALSALGRKRCHLCVPRGRSARRPRQRCREPL